MRRYLRLILVLAGLCVLYLLAFPMSTGTELVVRRGWAVSAATDSVNPAPPDASLVPVRLTDSFAFIAADGTVSYRGPAGHEVALSRDGFVSFGRVPVQLVLQDTTGSYVTTIPQAGYPQFAADGLYVLSGMDTVVSAYSLEGSFRWRLETEGPVNSIRSDGELTLLGLLAGGFVLVDAEGGRVPLEGIDQSYDQIAFGTVLDERTGTIAVIYGPPDPALVLYDRRAGRIVPTLRVELYRVPGADVPLEVTDDGQHLVFFDEGVRIVRIASGTEAVVKVNPKVRQIYTRTGTEMMGTVGLGDDPDPRRGFRKPAELVFFDRAGVVPVRVKFAASTVWLGPVGEDICLLVDDRVLCFRVEVE